MISGYVTISMQRESFVKSSYANWLLFSVDGLEKWENLNNSLIQVRLLKTESACCVCGKSHS